MAISFFFFEQNFLAISTFPFVCSSLSRPIFLCSTWHDIPMMTSIVLIIFSYCLKSYQTFRALDRLISVLFCMLFHCTDSGVFLCAIQASVHVFPCVCFNMTLESRRELERCIAVVIQILVGKYPMGLFMLIMTICHLKLFIAVSACETYSWMMWYNVVFQSTVYQRTCCI